MRGMELGESRARRETPRGAPRGSPAAALTKRHTPAAPSTDAYSLSGQGPPTSAPPGDAPSLPLPAFGSCWPSSAFLGLQTRHSALRLCGHMAFVPVCPHMPFLKGHQSLDQGPSESSTTSL